jgi:uncharacterized membrane protein (UPF0127 family)
MTASYRWGSLTLVWALACNGASAPATPPASASSEPKQETSVVTTKPRPPGDPQPKLPVGLLEFEDEAPRAPLMTLEVEVAATEEQRAKGMMFREQMGEGEGMLFIFPDEDERRFWMHNTLLPLDMFFIDAHWNVVGVVHDAEPLTDTSRYVPGKKSQYVLDVNGGFARRHGFAKGQKLRFIAPDEKP